MLFFIYLFSNSEVTRSYLKNASSVQWLRCRLERGAPLPRVPAGNAHVLKCTLRFQTTGRLAIKRDLLFLRQLL